MKLHEFRKLIREEIRRTIQEGNYGEGNYGKHNAEDFLNERKMIIYPVMDKSVKTPWGKGGPRSTVILGKTSSGLSVTLNGDFVNSKSNTYVTKPTDEDKKEAKEMVEFHYNRLTGGVNKEKLAAVMQSFGIKS